jgi:hypothetical protein
MDETSPTWKTMIIANMQDFQHPDLSTIFQSDDPLYLVSDGSLIEHNGGYAAVFATDSNYISTTYGATPYVSDLNTSFRTEAYGMLGGLIMLATIFKASNTVLPTTRIISVYIATASP